MPAMEEMEERLRQMMVETCRCKLGSIERQRGLTHDSPADCQVGQAVERQFSLL